jgi:hypothetical protein
MLSKKTDMDSKRPFRSCFGEYVPVFKRAFGGDVALSFRIHKYCNRIPILRSLTGQAIDGLPVATESIS